MGESEYRRIDMSGPSQTMSIAEAAQALGVSKYLLYERARTTGEVVPGLPIIRIGSSLRVPREKLVMLARGDWGQQTGGPGGWG